MRFRTIIELGGKTATGFQVPQEVMDALGPAKRKAVRVTIGTHSYRSTVAPMGGKLLVPLSAENRTSAGVAAGDEVEVDLELDTEPRVLTVPVDLTEALVRDPAAKAYFDSLSYSHRQRYVLAVEGAKAPETRARRITKTIETLREGRT